MTQPQGDLPRNKPFTIQFPESLPITEKASEIIAAIKAHQVIIVAGETGSGKTTQIPKMCLEAGVGVSPRFRYHAASLRSSPRRGAKMLGVRSVLVTRQSDIPVSR
jgi:HrpA-like RNA helicase